MNNLFDPSPSGVYCIEHIIYFIITTILTIAGSIIIYKFVKKEKTTIIIIKSIAVCLLIVMIFQRIYTCYYHIILKKDPGYTWWFLFPNSICAMTSILISINVLFFKKDNIFIHCLFYIGFYGGVIDHFYPDFLNNEFIFTPQTFAGLLHHSITLFLVIVMYIKKYFIPKIKKWYAFPIGYCCFVLFGLFEVQVFKFKNGMNATTPLISSLPYLTSWYSIGLAMFGGVLIFEFLYEHFKNKKTFKEIVLEMKI